MQSRESSLPFFKPLQEQHTRGSSQQMQSFFAPLQHSQQMNVVDNEAHRMHQEQEEGTRLTSLHGRLQQEADKIRKWRTHTEMELKQKDKMILESKKTVESLRKSILDIQLQNENLSSKLKEEYDSRNEIALKVESTRDMCNLLKDHTSKVDQQLANYETERTELKYLEKEHAQQFNELSLKFKELNISSTNSLKNLKTELKSCEEKSKELVGQYSKEKIEAQSEIEELKMTLKQKLLALENVSSELSIKEERVAELNKENETIKTRLEENEAGLRSTNEELQILVENMSELKCMAEDMKASHKLTSEQLSHEQKDHSEYVEEQEKVLEDLAKEKKILEETLEREQRRYADLEANYRKCLLTVEDLKSNKDILIMEKTEANNKIEQLQHYQNELISTKEDLANEIATLKSQNEDFLSNIKALEQKISSLQADMETESETITKQSEDIQKLTSECETKENAITNCKNDNKLLEVKLAENEELVNELDNKVEGLKHQLEEKKKQENILSAEMQTTVGEKQAVEKEHSALKKENAKLKKDLEKISTKETKLEASAKDVSEKLQKITKEKEHLEESAQDELKQKDTELEELKLQVEEMENELQRRQEDLTSLSSKSLEVKSDSAAKNKHIKELEKEMRSLKSKLTSQTKRLAQQESEAKAAQDDLKSMEELKAKTEVESNTIKEDLQYANVQLEQMKVQVDEERQRATQSIKDKDDAKREFDCQMKEMIKTLDKFKEENQKIVSQKDTEMEQLRKQLGKKQVNKRLEKEHEEVKKELDTLTGLVETLKLEKSKVEKESKEKQEIIQTLESDLTVKESTIKDLQDTSNQCVPTTPKIKATIPTTPKAKTTPVASNAAKNVRLASTPRTPNLSNLAVVKAQPASKDKKATPLRTPTTVLCTPKNKSIGLNGILRQANSAPKKRRVMFSSEKTVEEPLSDSGESSTSELMEVEVDKVSDRKLVSKPSPSIRFSPAVPNNFKKHAVSGKTVSRQRTPKKSERPTKENDEIEEFKSLFPDQEVAGCFPGVKNKHLEDSPSPAKIRRPVAKSPGKFFKSQSRVSKAQKNKTETKLKWFDCDSIFGFEDDNEP